MSAEPRRLDHVVMPVASLEVSRRLFEAMGFLVASDAVHPFGTENACVFLADGTYIEPLAVAEREVCEAAAKDGNVFVAHDQAFRFRRGAPGFSGIAFGSEDATADHAAFGAAGIGDGEMLSFARRLELPDGTRRELAFRLAFARDRRSPDLSLFTCQAMQASGDRSALTRHPNGVLGLSRIVLSEPNPSDFHTLMQEMVGRRDHSADSFGLSIEARNVSIDCLSPDGLQLRYGRCRGEERGLLIEGLVLKVQDLAGLRAMLSGRHVEIETVGARLVACLPGGTGAFIAFEQAD